jgi:hypothetical protein
MPDIWQTLLALLKLPPTMPVLLLAPKPLVWVCPLADVVKSSANYAQTKTKTQIQNMIITIDFFNEYNRFG